jgi:hypothetical protein
LYTTIECTLCEHSIVMNKRSRCGHSIVTGKGQTILHVSLSDSSKDLSIFLFYVLM